MTHTILVVEDDVATLDLVGFTLERAGYDTALARTGEDALMRLLWLDAPALLVVDHDLHGSMHGSDLVRQARQLLRRSVSEPDSIPVIGLCGMTRRCEACMRKVGVVEVLRKPFSREQLLAAVGRHLPAAPTTPPP